MTLESGTRVGGYEIVGPLGRGGQSEVYRARDLNLSREVAIKVLPSGLARDPDKRARFEREAQLLAALSHKSIAVIHGIERSGDLSYLVLELIEGETLAERIKRAPLTLAEARAVFLQIAEALEAAHDKGIIHRDLKPANVKLLPGGAVKLLDFGLGKELRDAAPVEPATETFEGLHTTPGLVMGTPGYMSPEQTRGRMTSERTDIWSFGVCLFEALSGTHPFARETVPDILSAILKDEPPWNALPRGLPEAWRRLLHRTLRKDERSRLHDIGDVRIELADAPTELESAEGGSLRSHKPGSLSVPRWAVAAALTALAALLWISIRPGSSSLDVEPTVRRFTVELPATAPLSLDGGSALALSPDGRRLVYTARRGNRTQLYLRPAEQLDAVPIPGTEGAESPFFSPTGEEVGFFVNGSLSKISLTGGSPAVVGQAATGRGGSWSRDGTIVFAPESRGGLSVVPEGGGGAKAATPEEGESALAHRWPSVLPGGRFALSTLWTRSGTDTVVVDLETGETERLVDDASYARYLPSGHVVFARGEDLHAAVFDLGTRRLRGEPVLVLPSIAVDELTGAAFFDVSEDGALYYVAAESEISRPATLLSVDRNGEATPIGAPSPSLQLPRWSPDGRFVLTTIQRGDATDVWSLQLDRGNLTRLTFDGRSAAAVWAPDGQRIAFNSSREGKQAIYWKASDGSGEAETLTDGAGPLFPTSFSPDGETLAFTELNATTGFDVWLLSLRNHERSPLLAGPYAEAGAQFSPDGRFLAYTSDESGRDEVYVHGFEGATRRFQVSTESGSEPMWSRNGTELYYRSGTRLMAVSVATSPTFEASRPRELFDIPVDGAGSLYANYDVSPDGRQFVMIRTEAGTAASRIHVVLNWLRELTARLPAR